MDTDVARLLARRAVSDAIRRQPTSIGGGLKPPHYSHEEMTMSGNGFWDAFTGGQPNPPNDAAAREKYLQDHQAEVKRQEEQRRLAEKRD